jgi:hypothetical protein
MIAEPPQKGIVHLVVRELAIVAAGVFKDQAAPNVVSISQEWIPVECLSRDVEKAAIVSMVGVHKTADKNRSERSEDEQ